MKSTAILLALLIATAFASTKVHAAVNLQTCTVTPTSGGVAGCPFANVTFAPVAPTTLVRSQVNSIQGWRAFSTLQPGDQVYAADGSWHALSSLTVARSAPPPPVTPSVPPSPPPGLDTQSVTITLVGGQAPQAVTFSSVGSPACFALSTPTGPYKQICMP